MIKPILFGKWGGHWQWTIFWRLFYRFKAFICCVLNREPDRNVNLYDYTSVTITYTDSGKAWSEYGTNYWFEAIGVGVGVFRNWWVTYYQGSSD